LERFGIDQIAFILEIMKAADKLANQRSIFLGAKAFGNQLIEFIMLSSLEKEANSIKEIFFLIKVIEIDAMNSIFDEVNDVIQAVNQPVDIFPVKKE